MLQWWSLPCLCEQPHNLVGQEGSLWIFRAWYYTSIKIDPRATKLHWAELEIGYRSICLVGLVLQRKLEKNNMKTDWNNKNKEE